MGGNTIDRVGWVLPQLKEGGYFYCYVDQVRDFEHKRDIMKQAFQKMYFDGSEQEGKREERPKQDCFSSPPRG